VNTFEKVLQSVTEKAAWVAQFAIVSCMAFVVFDIVKRSLGFGLVLGVPEVVELISAIILSMGIGYLTFVRGHVAVDVLVMRFRPRVQAIFEIVISAISLGIAVLLTWGMLQFAMYNQSAGWVTGALLIPRAPFQYVVTAALVLTCVVLIRDLVKAVIMVRTGGGA
jgi:TRAP-type C4-dicarboxylate transport system permease small subunit